MILINIFYNILGIDTAASNCTGKGVLPSCSLPFICVWSRFSHKGFGRAVYNRHIPLCPVYLNIAKKWAVVCKGFSKRRFLSFLSTSMGKNVCMYGDHARFWASTEKFFKENINHTLLSLQIKLSTSYLVVALELQD